jgi:hypothetical protein
MYPLCRLSVIGVKVLCKYLHESRYCIVPLENGINVHEVLVALDNKVVHLDQAASTFYTTEPSGSGLYNYSYKHQDLAYIIKITNKNNMTTHMTSR